MFWKCSNKMGSKRSFGCFPPPPTTSIVPCPLCWSFSAGSPFEIKYCSTISSPLEGFFSTVEKLFIQEVNVRGSGRFSKSLYFSLSYTFLCSIPLFSCHCVFPITQHSLWGVIDTQWICLVVTLHKAMFSRGFRKPNSRVLIGLLLDFFFLVTSRK